MDSVARAARGSAAMGVSVFGLAAGCLGTYVHAYHDTLAALPAHLRHDEAASMPTVFVTVDLALCKAAHTQAHERVLVHAAAGGVGMAALQLVRGTIGAVVYATAGSSAKRHCVRSCAVRHVGSSRATSFPDLAVQTAGAADVVLNSLTSAGVVAATLSCTAAGARMVEIGKRDIWTSASVRAERADASLSLVAVDFLPRDAMHAAMRRVAAYAHAMRYRPLGVTAHAISRTHAALRQMSQARHVGKIVVCAPRALYDDVVSSGGVAVCGGLGSLGTLTASWLAGVKATRLGLLGRSGRAATMSASLMRSASLVRMQRCDAATAGDRAALVTSDELPRATAGAPTGVRRYSSSARHSSSSASGAQAAAPVKLPHLEAMLEEAKGNGTFKRERTITTPQGAHVHVAEADDDVLVMCANNYLGLANHPRIKEAAVSAIATHGVGMASVRFICGTSDLHTQLERRIADFHHTDDCILYPSCFDANAGLFETILGPEDAVISDALNHASIIDGVRLCKAKRFRYANCDMADLEAKLVEARDARVRLIATDGVFSMDSTMAPLKEIVRLARKHDALVMVDECHATGVIGATGRGTLEVEGVLGEVDIVTSTLGKAMGGASGGFTAGRQQVVDVLRQKSRPYLFSNTVAPPIVAAASAAFDILEEEGEALLGRIRRNAETFRARLTEAGFELKPGNHPIIPVMLHDAQKASDFAVELQKRGVYAVAFSYPVVPKGQARIRTQMSAAHTPEDIAFAADTFIAAGKAVGAIP